jgi:hypothetical protein
MVHVHSHTDNIKGSVVEPVQSVHLGILAIRQFGHFVPLLDQQFQVVMHVLFELTNAL